LRIAVGAEVWVSFKASSVRFIGGLQNKSKVVGNR
jgi:hypothetical protein